MGVLEGCDRFLKYIFFFFTFVLFLVGISAIVIGIWAAVDNNFTDILKLNIPGLDAHKIKEAAILLIIVGVGVMIVGFLGCCGASKENQCLLTFFFLALLLVFVLMITGAVMATSYQSILKEILDKGLAEMKKGYDTSAEFKKSVNNIQQDFQCCLFKPNEKDHASCYPKQPTSAPAAPTAAPVAPTTAAGNSSATGAPTSAPATQAPTGAPTAAPGAFTANCAEAIMKKVNLALDVYKVRIVGIGVAAAIIVVLGMVVSMALCCKIRKGYASV